MVRVAIALIAALMISGCTAMTYQSDKPAEVVSSCIADGWKKVPSSGFELPITLTKTENYYFVDVI